jgi:hypothetical protein
MLVAIDQWDWACLSLSDRLSTCRQMASEALRLSGAATGESKHRYEDLANAWLELAADIERAHGLRAGPPVNSTVQIQS